MSNSITRINPPSLPDAGEMGYSQISIVEPGRMAYISGQVAWQVNGEPTPPGLVEQTEIVCQNALAALEAAGAKPADVAMVRIYIVDLTSEKLESMMPAFMGAFGETQPCITGVGVASLAAPDLLVEMELTVRLPN